MNIVLCPDKFKGSISSKDVCAAISIGLLKSRGDCNILEHPMADGGDGSIEILKDRLSIHEVEIETEDPLGRDITASYYISDDTAFIELASASGLVLLEDQERNPMNTSTKGTGRMIKHAIANGFQKIYLFIGGSATNDAGIGIADVLGFEFISENGKKIEPIGKNLIDIRSIKNNSNLNLKNIELTVLCDVTNPMHGTNGAAHVYAKQKGANMEEIEHLDHGLNDYAMILNSELDYDISQIPGMGAAGAVAASLIGLIGANIQNGFQMVADLTDLESVIAQADIVITGEGKIDQTSFQGKVVGNVLSLCEKYQKPCGIVGGMIDNDVEDQKSKFIFLKSILDLAQDKKEAMTSPKKYLIEIGKELGAMI